MHEFDVIKKYFTWDNSPSDVIKSVGDDAAILEIKPDEQLVTSIDTFISGVHFPENTPVDAIGHKALAVNLSDLAAMGATPRWFTLALTLPEIDQNWLTEFSQGLQGLARQYNCFLVGGDTTRGALSITIQVMGVIEKGKALMRSGANVGDALYVTGTLGDAAIGLKTILDNLTLTDSSHTKFCQDRLNKPTPRITESQIIREYATACIDLSDGFFQDLGHILKASSCGAEINIAQIPLSKTLSALPIKNAMNAALSGGDDYELLFTIPKSKQQDFEKSIKNRGGGYTCIGRITDQSGCIKNELGEPVSAFTASGYNHFMDSANQKM